jgi:nucleoid-associated protein YgaU
MKGFFKISVALALVFGLSLLVNANTAFSQEKMSMEDYEAQLAQWQQRETDAKAAIARIEAEIEALKADISQADADITACWDEIYSMVGSDEAGVKAFINDLKGLQSRVNGLMALSPEELFRRKGELAEIEAEFAKMKENDMYALSSVRNVGAEVEAGIAQLKAKMPKAVYDDYIVMRGDYLWKIAGKSDIYGDPYQWMRIYSSNKDMISDPDLIYPDWVLKIQRGVGPDQYLVLKGDFLQKIAENPDVLNNPAEWTKIYEANKDIIGDNPSLIYPYTVLVIPKN